MIPSIRAPGRAGNIFPSMAALPRCSKIPITLLTLLKNAYTTTADFTAFTVFSESARTVTGRQCPKPPKTGVSPEK